jgi:hypothetical protein
MTVLNEKCPTSLHGTRCFAQTGYLKFQTNGWCN